MVGTSPKVDISSPKSMKYLIVNMKALKHSLIELRIKNLGYSSFLFKEADPTVRKNRIRPLNFIQYLVIQIVEEEKKRFRGILICMYTNTGSATLYTVSSHMH